MEQKNCQQYFSRLNFDDCGKQSRRKGNDDKRCYEFNELERIKLKTSYFKHHSDSYLNKKNGFGIWNFKIWNLCRK